MKKKRKKMFFTKCKYSIFFYWKHLIFAKEALKAGGVGVFTEFGVFKFIFQKNFWGSVKLFILS